MVTKSELHLEDVIAGELTEAIYENSAKRTIWNNLGENFI